MSPVDRIEKVEVDERGPRQHRREVVADIGKERKETLRKVVNIIWLLVITLEILIGLRFLLKLLAANPNNAFAAFIYSLTDVFLLPFLSLTGSPGANGFVLDVPAAIGALVYLAFGWVVVKLIWLLFKPTRARAIATYEEN